MEVALPPGFVVALGELRMGWLAMCTQMAMNAQGQAARFTTTLLAEQLERPGKRVQVLRCEESRPSANQAHLLQLDSASKEALDLMKQLGNEDGQLTYRWCQLPGDHRGELLTKIFERVPGIDHSGRGEVT